MFLIKRRFFLPAAMLAVLLLSAFLPGCGLRQSQTGSLSSRIIDADGNAVANAEVFSIFVESEKVFTAADGSFYLAELPAGLNNIIISHPDFALEERQIEIKSANATVVESIRLDKANAPNRISNVKVDAVSSTTANISWNTYRSVICNVDYGKTPAYGQIYREQRPAAEHSAVLSDLDPETVYHFRVQYIGEQAFTYYSYDFSLRTMMADRPSAPVALKILPLTAMNAVSLEWSPAPGPSVDGYNVYRSEAGEDWLKLNETVLGKNVRAYTDQAALPGTFCRYAIAAVNPFVAESEKMVSATIFVPGIITRNVFIKAVNSPIKVYSDLMIAAGVNFEVEAGCEFLVAASDAFASGLDEQRIEVVAHGRLALNGTDAAPIVFAPLDGEGKRDHWAGIRILSHLSGISQLEHVQLFGCSGYALEVAAQRARVSDLSVSYSEKGMLLDGVLDFMDLDSCRFNEISDVALQINKCRRVQLTNGLFTAVNTAVSNFTDYADDQLIIKKSQLSCRKVGVSGTFGKLKLLNLVVVVPDGVGLEFENALNTRENYVDHCTIDALNGVVVKNGAFIIENNIITNKNAVGSAGITNSSILSPDYMFNNVFGFANGYVGCQKGIGAVESSPKFVGGNPFSYQLQPDSTLKLQDRYGSEIGAYGSSRF